MRFKVGDTVVITKLSEKVGYTKDQIRNYEQSIGRVEKIMYLMSGQDTYVLTGPVPGHWLDDEVELYKNHIIKEIIKDL